MIFINLGACLASLISHPLLESDVVLLPAALYKGATVDSYLTLDADLRVFRPPTSSPSCLYRLVWSIIRKFLYSGSCEYALRWWLTSIWQIGIHTKYLYSSLLSRLTSVKLSLRYHEIPYELSIPDISYCVIH